MIQSKNGYQNRGTQYCCREHSRWKAKAPARIQKEDHISKDCPYLWLSRIIRVYVGTTGQQSWEGILGLFCGWIQMTDHSLLIFLMLEN